MKNNLFLLLVWLIPTSTVFAQNLVPNPGFEVQDSCPLVSELFRAAPWHSPTLGTPDAFNTTCSNQQGNPQTGIGCGGIIVYSTLPDNREYMQVRLTSPLVAGQNYQVSFSVLHYDFFGKQVDRIGAFLSTDSVGQNNISVLSNYPPQVENPAGQILPSSYTTISGIFTASGGEEWLIIGNFRDDAGTQTFTTSTTAPQQSYYFVDDVSVEMTSATSADGSRTLEEFITVFPNPSAGPFNLSISNPNLKAVELKVFDPSGKMVAEKQMSSAVLDDQFNLDHLKPGIYILQCETQKGTLRKQIILQ